MRQGHEELLAEVARAAAAEAGVPEELLGDYLPLLLETAVDGHRPRRAQLDSVGDFGRRAAEEGVSAGSAVELYLSAAWRLWKDLPELTRSRDGEDVRQAAEAVLHLVADAVVELAEGYNEARRQLIRREEASRRELVDDLLRGDSDVGAIVQRAEPFGLDFTRAHQVVLAAPQQGLPDADAATGFLERAVLDWLGDRDVLAATKDGMLVVIAPDPTGGARKARGTSDLGAMVHTELERYPHGGPWQVALGRPYPGSYGIARSYEEAREALAIAGRMRMRVPVIHADEMVVYRVLVRDQPAMADLVHAVLGPLQQARGGAEPLLETLEVFFATGGVATETARRLHLSVRAVTYRLERVTALTGFDPTQPADRFSVHAAVLGAKLFGWPTHPVTPGQ